MMRTMSYKKLLLILFAVFTASAIYAQDGDYEPTEFRADFTERKKSIMDGNLMRATYHNYGQGGTVNKGQNPDEVPYEYPRNTGREYMLFQMVFMGAEVENQIDNPADEFEAFPIVDVANLRTSNTGSSWSLNPIRGYSNSGTNEIARSDRGPGSSLGNTWPPFWPDKQVDGGDGWAGSWNGYFGRDQFNADIEFYYRAGDDDYTRYAVQTENSTRLYRPDSTDADRGGLALMMDTRIMTWSQTLINNVHFNIFEVTNDASFNYDKVAFSLWIADFVGENASNDVPQFDEIQATAYITDDDRTQYAPYFEGPIGEMGMKFLETPGNPLDGIDNDGDSYRFDPTNSNPGGLALYDSDNENVYLPLTEAGDGFYGATQLRDTLIPSFTAEDFEDRGLNPGSKIVLIQDDDSRVIAEYPQGGGTVVSQGISYDLPANGINLSERFEADLRWHADQIDNDLDGLIDENEPNHLEKTITISPSDITGTRIAVRHINYLAFEIGDTLRRGLIVPNSVIRERISTDDNFAELVNNRYNGRFINVHTAAPMMDEDRADYFDNDQDWNPLIDDVGVDGDGDTPDTGQGDGLPTTGAGTAFPGEPSIDKTDVSETDLIGVSRVTIIGSGILSTNEDSRNWNTYMIPGDFETDAIAGDDSDIFVSSSLFPLRRGQTERFAMAISAVQTMSQSRENDREANNRALTEAQKAYEADYQFATAPIPPKVTAVSGDGYVTLYWEPNAEQSFDRYLQKLTGNGFDFEGYKIYRSTDDAFEDARTITNAFGAAQFLQPIATFDRNNGNAGLHPVPVNGVQYNLGGDSGLQYSFTDTNVNNGQRYFYAVVAYDFGSEMAGIAPSESPIQISRNPDGSLILGENVVDLRPAVREAGYRDADTPEVSLLSGSPGGSVEVDVVDPTVLREGSTYHVVFEDTTLRDDDGNPESLATKNFSLVDITGGASDSLIKRSNKFNGESLPIIDGLRFVLQNVEELRLNQQLSGWVTNEDASELSRHNYNFTFFQNFKVNDYDIIIGDEVGFGQSVARNNVPISANNTIDVPSVPTNFKIYSPYEDKFIDYAFDDKDGPNDEPGELGVYRTSFFRQPRPDNVYLIEEVNGQPDKFTYRLNLSYILQADTVASVNPQPGDTLKIRYTKPFIEGDIFEIKINENNTARIDQELAKEELDDIKVVPNPYVVSSPYEGRITSNNPVQQRELHFTKIPVPSTLRIFTISGVMIREIQLAENDPRIHGGTFIWDMLTKDDLEISYGIYLYHVKAPGIGDKTGKFAIIK